VLKIVADTNIFISAHNFHGKPEEILKLAQFKKIALYTSPEIILEFSKVVLAKFNWPQERLRKVLKTFDEYIYTVYPATSLQVIKDDPSDDRILECAVAAGADFIVTGDEKHLLKLKQFRRIKIINPAKFLETYLKN